MIIPIRRRIVDFYNSLAMKPDSLAQFYTKFTSSDSPATISLPTPVVEREIGHFNVFNMPT